MRHRIGFILLCLLAAGCSHYTGTLLRENKLTPTPDIQPASSPQPAAWPDDAITYSWLGHATVLINFNGKRILTDPVLLARIGPPEMFDNAFGIRRITRLPLAVESLPEIDVVLISHAHYDHLDKASLATLQRQQRRPPLLIVPRDTRSLVEDYSDRIVELDWLDKGEAELDLENDLQIRAFRVEHYARAGWGDRDAARGFNGYEIRSDRTGQHVLFFGDTAYRRYRDEHGDVLDQPVNVDWQGKFSAATIVNRPDLCIIPVGDGYYYWNHTGPQQALQIADQVNCETMLPIHYDTFILTPPEKQPQAIKQELVDAAQTYIDRVSLACRTPGGHYRYPDVGVTCIAGERQTDSGQP
jgi:L-ascorbate metabolism protein UlaG (beta-lactamase superfamily)